MAAWVAVGGVLVLAGWFWWTGDRHSVLWHGLDVAWRAAGYLLPVWSVATDRRDRSRKLMAELSGEQQREAYRAALHGPVPQDPRVLDAAVRFGRAELDRMQRKGTEEFVPLFTVIGLVALVVSGFADSPWWWLGIPATVAGFLEFRRRTADLKRWHGRLRRAAGA